MSKFANKSVLVTHGNLGMVAAGTVLFPAPSADGTSFVNAQPGQLFAADPNTLVAVDNTTLSATNIDKLIFGVAVDNDGDGLADTFRSVAGDALYGAYIDALEAEAPACGLPAIKDFLFKCTDVDSSYSVKIALENNLTRSYYPLNRGEEFVLTADTNDPSCTSCSTTHDCSEVACRLVDSFYRTALANYPDWRQPRKNFPVEVHRLFDQDYEFCLTPEGNTCDDCLAVPALNTFTVGTGGDAVEHALTHTINLADNTQTLIPQLARLVSQINTILDGLGHATISRGTGGCCPIKLLINTCQDIFVGHNDGETTTNLTPCNENEDQSLPNPLDPIANTNDCPSCGDVATTTTYDCGIRVIVKPELLDCTCNYPTLPPKAYFFGKMDIFPIDGWVNGSTTVVEKQAIQIPQNFGYWVKWEEYSQNSHGRGKSWMPFNINRGQLGLPQAGGRIDALTYSDCKKDYCSYDIAHRIPWSDWGNDGTYKSPSAHTRIFVPFNDSTTKTSIQAFWTAYVALLPTFHKKSAITCASDLEAGTLDINGSIR